MATQAAPKTRAKKGEGPLVVTFSDSKGKNDYKRVPAEVQNVIITDRAGIAKEYSVQKFSPAVRDALAAVAFATRAKTFVINNSKDGKSVISLADQVYSDFLSGKMYSRAEGGKRPGKVFDPVDYVEAYRRVKEAQSKAGVKNKAGKPVKAATPEDLKRFSDKLVGMDKTSRGAELKKMLLNGAFKKYLMAVKASKVKTDEDTAIEDMF